jgi:enoyl-CoA hydratase/carnithine racemase
MREEPVVRIEDRGRVRVLTLNRPGQLNAFNDALYDAFGGALREAADDRNVSVVVVTGAGRAFCAGQDLGELENRPQYDDGVPHGFQPFMDVLQSFPKPLIAAVNGIGVGIGLTMLPHCDLVLMAESARLRAPFVSLGVTAEAASTVLLPATIGWAETAHLLYTASWLPAAKAVELGLAWRCVTDTQLMTEALALAEQIAAMPVTSLVATKQLLVASRIEAIQQARDRENATFESLEGGPANREAIAAFKEKRGPDFSRISADPA